MKRDSIGLVVLGILICVSLGIYVARGETSADATPADAVTGQWEGEATSLDGALVVKRVALDTASEDEATIVVDIENATDGKQAFAVAVRYDKSSFPEASGYTCEPFLLKPEQDTTFRVEAQTHGLKGVTFEVSVAAIHPTEVDHWSYSSLPGHREAFLTKTLLPASSQ